MPHNAPTITHFDDTTVTEDEVNPATHRTRSFAFGGVPRENRTDKSRLAERAMLQGAKGGLLEERLVVNGVEEEF